MFTSSLLVFILGATCASAAVFRRDSTPGYIDPNSNGGSMLDLAVVATNTSGQLGEPLNVIISANSDSRVLTDDGFVNFVNSLGLSEECLGQHLGGPQQANLGDGQGWVNQLAEYRADFGISIFGIGACLESLVGGNHLRYWRQSTTGALFLAVSHEEDLSQSHNISPDGYDQGRNQLIAAAQGGSSFGGTNYMTNVQLVTGLLPAGSNGVNHGIATDGTTAVFTVSII